MARYNLWQNRRLVAAAGALSDTARREQRGAFFGSIAGTFSHLLWGDLRWLSRFDGGRPPEGDTADSATAFPDWGAFCRERVATDMRINDWVLRLTPEMLAGELFWYSGAAGRHVHRPFALVATHFFNHQTHHRGQIHAMLTAAGARPGDTDLFLMPATLE
ncbi:MAG: DinB family protein [Gemmobacter sp.]